jgi:hypothetical protein
MNVGRTLAANLARFAAEAAALAVTGIFSRPRRRLK